MLVCELFEVPEELTEVFVFDHQFIEGNVAKGDRPVGVQKALSKLKVFPVLPFAMEHIQFIENELIDKLQPELANHSATDSVQRWQVVQNFEENIQR